MALPPGLGPRLQPLSGLTIPWAEYLSHKYQSGTVSMGPDGVTANMTIIVNHDDLDKAVQQLLGYSYVSALDEDIANNTLLKRVLPWRHPRWNQLWCTRISRYQGLQKLNDLQTIIMTPIVGDSLLGYSTKYTYALLDLVFTRPDYIIMTDEQVLDDGAPPAQEWLRYTSRAWDVGVQMLTREGRIFKFTEGGPGITGVQIPASVGYPIGKFGLQRTWYQIPQEGVFTAEPAGFPLNLVYQRGNTTLPMLATVNDATFLGCEAGTLLYLGPKIKERPLQIPANLMLIIVFNFQLQYDITFNFSFFDPPRGGAGRGHLTAPAPKDNLWYRIATLTDQPVIQSRDFTALFELITPV